ncbi:RsmB/NOP family class I SAM-dependent RNA methyltransferase [Guyparkeria hydrothermalis]|uniref:RsmB/NOP family class I SAM-dependent RNA methyltransferase n=1 Tax=Guyparkeria TaxID=2035712 RepID=UPI0010AD2089|nr:MULTISPECIES: RsmB/NOP family class I SAM-dependent RNA methyltransferase [Guyparkeria]MCL7750997.1 RsmB/NOP family class I SAM-dependent RNA methyltransferase [Guyparkeria hydrothermalis]TKA88907.1 RsmB/NOP family class I SAM-dependent RNA methyltransferase [Guyparkeria sp. SB14A]
MTHPTPTHPSPAGGDWPRPDLPRGRTFPAQLHLAAELLERITEEGLPADRSLQRELAARRKMGRRDRERVRELTLFVLRQRRVLDWLLDDDAPSMAARLAAALSLADALDPVLAEAAGLAAETTTRLAARAAEPFDQLPDDVRFNLSAAAAGQWRAWQPDDPDTLARALDARAPVDLHANPRHADRDALIGELAEADIEATPIAGLPLGLRLGRPARLTRLPAFEAGGFEVQDAGSQWVVRALEARPGERVLDLCAGAGGKSLGLLDEARGDLALTACDLHAERLERLARRAARHGDTRLDQRALDATRPLPADLSGFDRVLVDAPCSGSGTWRRHPELRWARIDWAGLADTQRRLLEQAANATRPGGRLVYATCSLWPVENEAIVEDFLARHPGWHATRPALDGLPDDAVTPAGWIRLRPDRHGCDGFFIACVQAPDEQPTA